MNTSLHAIATGALAAVITLGAVGLWTALLVIGTDRAARSRP